MGHAVWQVHGTGAETHRLHDILPNNVLYFFHSSSSSCLPHEHSMPELEPEPPDSAAKVFWPVLRPVWGQEHQGCCDEQYFTTLCTHAPQV